jgi:hypothetical protein
MKQRRKIPAPFTGQSQGGNNAVLPLRAPKFTPALSSAIPCRALWTRLDRDEVELQEKSFVVFWTHPSEGCAVFRCNRFQ